jgi:hypothetical protein
MRNLKSILFSFMTLLFLGMTFGLRSRTSFTKVWTPTSLPQTAFFSGWCVANSAGACSSTGKYRASGTMLMQIGSGWVIQTFVPMHDASGFSYISTWTMPPLNYVPLSDSGVYFNLNSGTYYTTNPLWFITWVDLSTYLSGYTVTGSARTYSGTTWDIPSTKAVSLYLDQQSQSLGDIYTTGSYYVSGSTISRMGLLSGVLTLQDYTGWIRVPQICVAQTNVLNTGWSFPGSTQIPTTYAVSTYLNTIALDLGDMMTTGSYLITATGTVTQGSWRTTISWGNLSFQVYTGGAWVEKWFFTAN